MSNEEAIKIIEVGDISNRWGCGGEVERMAIEALMQTTWIPVSERVPEEPQMVLITPKNWKSLEIGFYNKNGKWEWLADSAACYWEELEVSAWMPAPKLYEGSDDPLNDNEKAMLYIKECAESVGIEVKAETPFTIPFMAEIMQRLRKKENKK